MTDDVRELLEVALRGEPPMGLDRAGVIADGKRRLRRRRQAAVGGVTLAVAFAVFGAAAISGGAFGLRPEQVGPAAPPPSTSSSVDPGAPAAAPAPVSTVTQSPVAPSTSPGTRAPEMEYPDYSTFATSMREMAKKWPAEIFTKTSYEGAYEWNTKGPDGWMKATLHTKLGNRLLTVRMYYTGEFSHSTACQQQPSCYTRVQDRTPLRVTRTEERPTIVQVVADRPDGRTVEVTETIGEGSGWRFDQVLGDDLLISIAVGAGPRG
ncbi:hypothetical protein V5P93_007154 [Actinokineospora auranticolor]|uniref:Uncharacterized protein n=1 Tax=Actinokineospora auranticolor TaxID=155976 RepID=A0A2S6GRE6_9PSEU|nr:hypothetical protein [Actinokineospora auranticolor]PPK67812.1 hypothetical protein CLV40_10642 [Actinokineospora auranticolor]